MSTAKYTHEHVRSTRGIDPRSIRSLKRGEHVVRVGCPKGEWSRGRCSVSMILLSILHPVKENPEACLMENPGALWHHVRAEMFDRLAERSETWAGKREYRRLSEENKEAEAASKNPIDMPSRQERLSMLERKERAIRSVQGRRRNPRTFNLKTLWQDGEVKVTTWFERDRAHVAIVRADTGKSYIDWWDDDVQQLFGDGFFASGRKFEESVIDYAMSLGVGE